MRSILLGLILLPAFATAQRLDHYDLLLFSLERPGDDYTLATPRFLTAFNPRGYNNQPAFVSTTELFVTVQDPRDTTQTEIYLLDLGARQRERVTETPTPEYSATLLPGGGRFSCVRVEADGSQRLWSFPVDRSDNGEPVFYDLLNVGYHCWLRDTLVALFLVAQNGTAHTLAVAATNGTAPTPIVANIGRCLQRLPDGRLGYVQKATEQTWFLKAYDPVRKQSEILEKTLPGVEDFAVLPDGTFLAGKDARLYQWRPGQKNGWREVANLAGLDVREISRLAVSPDGRRIAVVVR
jgi:dipeptidyl aminopeptidase/acylaminoacyl peptidase